MKTNKPLSSFLLLALIATPSVSAWAARKVADSNNLDSSSSSSSATLPVLATAPVTDGLTEESKKTDMPVSESSAAQAAPSPTPIGHVGLLFSPRESLFEEMRAALRRLSLKRGGLPITEEDIMLCHEESSSAIRTGDAYAAGDFVVFRRTIFRLKFRSKDQETTWRRISIMDSPLVHASFEFGKIPDGTCTLFAINWPKFSSDGILIE
jgi:hypothetical protein